MEYIRPVVAVDDIVENNCLFVYLETGDLKPFLGLTVVSVLPHGRALC